MASGDNDDGRITLQLTLSPELTIDSVDWSISGNGIVPITGTIDVSATNAISVAITGIPADTNPYTATMTAKVRPPSTVTCQGSVPVTVADGETTQADIILQCMRPHTPTPAP
ncbi:MAG TPA: hypothetical protein VN903_20290 [Polyangia bacterium]|nr:hypothetical protein [Polyangia bacterium]